MTSRHVEPGTRNWLIQVGEGVRLTLHVQPRASRTGIDGLHGDAIKIRLAAPPVDGAANESLVCFLSATLGRPRSAITLTAGVGSRRKLVEVAGITAAEAMRRLGLGGDPERG